MMACNVPKVYDFCIAQYCYIFFVSCHIPASAIIIPYCTKDTAFVELLLNVLFCFNFIRTINHISPKGEWNLINQHNFVCNE